MRMQGNTILVAGGSSGIGRGLAELLCRLGNEVIVFDARPGVAQALARANPGMRAVDLDLGSPWSVAGFCEQVTATCPALNMLVNVCIAYPASHLPGLQALLDEDDSQEKLEAHRLGIQQLTGALLPQFRKRPHSAVFNVSAGTMLARSNARRGRDRQSPVIDGGLPSCTQSVRKRWSGASIEVIDIALPSRAERMSPQPDSASQGMPRGEFISSVVQLLAEGMHEAEALARLRSLWPQTDTASRRAQNDDLLTQAG